MAPALRRLLVAFVAAGGVGWAAPPLLPPVDGHLAGGVAWARLPHAPGLEWTVATGRAQDGHQHVSFTVRGAGTELNAEADLDPTSGDGTWRVKAGTLDLAAWSRCATELAGKAAAGDTIAGRVTLTGTGEWRGGRATGELEVALQDGSVANASAGWRLDGIVLNGGFAIDSGTLGVRSTAPLTLSVGTITTSRFGARNLTLMGSLQDRATFHLNAARLEIAGGDMTASATTVHLNPLAFGVHVIVNRIGLQDVAALVPTALRSARGRLDGDVGLGWSSEAGLEIGRGHLVLRADEPAEVTLRPFPGLFTSGLPTWIFKIPEWLVRWSMPALRKAELGQAPIEAQTLDVTFSPYPDAEGRSAVVHLTGVPKGAVTNTPVEVTANVYGSLKPFVHLGSGAKFSFDLQ